MFPSLLPAFHLADPVVAFAQDSFRRTPKMEIQDAYKWLYQATMGAEHAIRDPAGPKRILDQEWASLGPVRGGEPLLERLLPDGSLVRVNLRPYKARSGSKEELLEAFLRSARATKPNLPRFRKAWDAYRKEHAAGRSGREFDQRMSSSGYPSVHHSAAYARAYAPAYRVLTGLEARKLISRLPGMRRRIRE